MDSQPSLKQILNRAREQESAIGQFNFCTLEQLRAIVKASGEKERAVFLGTSGGESRFLGLEQIVALVRILKKQNPTPLFVHLDHGKDLGYIKKAIDLGYDSVHFDGSELPFEQNIKQTRKVVEYASQKGVIVEGEVGFLRESGKIKKADLTDPKKAAEFVEETGVDLLAVAIGNVHGIFPEMPELDWDRLDKIRRRTKAFLVLHGGSGLRKEDFRRAIDLGVSKININTALRLVWKKSLKRALAQSESIKPYQILPLVQQEIQNKVEEYIEVFTFSKNVDVES